MYKTNNYQIKLTSLSIFNITKLVTMCNTIITIFKYKRYYTFYKLNTNLN